jgi:hypothetical protein
VKMNSWRFNPTYTKHKRVNRSESEEQLPSGQFVVCSLVAEDDHRLWLTIGLQVAMDSRVVAGPAAVPRLLCPSMKRGGWHMVGS